MWDLQGKGAALVSAALGQTFELKLFLTGKTAHIPRGWADLVRVYLYLYLFEPGVSV